MTICVLCPHGLDSGLVSKAVAMAQGDPIRVLLPQSDSAEAAQLGAAWIHTLRDVPLDDTVTANWLAEKINQWNSRIILAPATVQMRSIMPMLAWHLQAGLTADCTDLSLENGILLQTRPAFGNSLMATIQTTSAIQMATVRPGTFRCRTQPCNTPQFIPETPPTGNIRPICIPYNGGKPLSQAQIIIAGGLGIGSREGFLKLEQAARKIGASVAASRNAVDAGFAPYSCQVGMTGICVCPKLYIAVGISGAVQHLAGFSGAEKVIAINTDPKAPIFDYADYGIIGDWETAIDKLLEELL